MGPVSPNQSPVTSVTLVGRLRNVEDLQAWQEFDRRYRELIVWFLRRRGLQVADAEDTAQAVITKLIGGLRTFEYDRSKRGFRAYLFRCARSGLSDFFSRQTGRPAAVCLDDRAVLPGTESDDESFAAFEKEWVDHHYRLAVRRYRSASDPKAVGVLEATIAGRSVRSIAEELSMSEPAVHKAQQRLRDRLREFIAEQLRDEEDTDEPKPR